MKFLTRWLVTGWIGLALLAPALPVQAQSKALTLSSLTIELWPEYDRPTMLVQISGTLDAGVALPAQVVVRIPAASGEPLAVATRSAAGTLVNAPFTTTVSGDQVLVTLVADTPDFHVEYYDPALAVSGAVRSYAFRWAPDYPVATTLVRLQAPVDSSQVTTDPPLTPAGVGDGGLNYYTGSWGALSAGQEVRLQLSYSKSTSRLSSGAVAASAPPAAPASAPGLTFSSPWLWGGVAGGLLVFGAAVWALWWLRSSQGEAPRLRSRRRRPVRPRRAGRSAAPEADARAPAATGFCTQCGERRLTGDRFCRSCGAPFRD